MTRKYGDRLSDVLLSRDSYNVAREQGGWMLADQEKSVIKQKLWIVSLVFTLAGTGISLLVGMLAADVTLWAALVFAGAFLAIPILWGVQVAANIIKRIT